MKDLTLKGIPLRSLIVAMLGVALILAGLVVPSAALGQEGTGPIGHGGLCPPGEEAFTPLPGGLFLVNLYCLFGPGPLPITLADVLSRPYASPEIIQLVLASPGSVQWFRGIDPTVSLRPNGLAAPITQRPGTWVPVGSSYDAVSQTYSVQVDPGFSIYGAFFGLPAVPGVAAPEGLAITDTGDVPANELIPSQSGPSPLVNALRILAIVGGLGLLAYAAYDGQKKLVRPLSNA